MYVCMYIIMLGGSFHFCLDSTLNTKKFKWTRSIASVQLQSFDFLYIVRSKRGHPRPPARTLWPVWCIKGLFTWKWGTQGRWDNPLRWGKKNNPPLHVILQPRHPGMHVHFQDYWMVAKHVNKKNAGKPRVLAINARLHSSAALATAFSAVAFYCYL